MPDFVLLQTQASQPELRVLRSLLNSARAEVTVAQSDLVAARTEETRKRELKAAQLKKDATLGEVAGVWAHHCGVVEHRVVFKRRQSVQMFHLGWLLQAWAMFTTQSCSTASAATLCCRSTHNSGRKWFILSLPTNTRMHWQPVTV